MVFSISLEVMNLLFKHYRQIRTLPIYACYYVEVVSKNYNHKGFGSHLNWSDNIILNMSFVHSTHPASKDASYILAAFKWKIDNLQ